MTHAEFPTEGTVMTFGGKDAARIVVRDGFVFSMEYRKTGVRFQQVLAIWRSNREPGSAIYAIANVDTDKETMLGCAVMAFDYLQVKKFSMKRVKGMADNIDEFRRYMQSTMPPNR